MSLSLTSNAIATISFQSSPWRMKFENASRSLKVIWTPTYLHPIHITHKPPACLAQHSLTLTNIANINILISSMDLFARVNAVYATHFGTSPPARACVTADLPSPVRVRLDCIAFADTNPSSRQALHVQGLSYWAPANIGPYSQAIIVSSVALPVLLTPILTGNPLLPRHIPQVDEHVFISGQIGLIPSNLTLPSPRSLALEAALSFQHVHRVVDALKNNSGGGWAGHCQSILYWLVSADDVPPVRAASMQLEGVRGSCTVRLMSRWIG